MWFEERLRYRSETFFWLRLQEDKRERQGGGKKFFMDTQTNLFRGFFYYICMHLDGKIAEEIERNQDVC